MTRGRIHVVDVSDAKKKKRRINAPTLSELEKHCQSVRLIGALARRQPFAGGCAREDEALSTRAKLWTRASDEGGCRKADEPI